MNKIVCLILLLVFIMTNAKVTKTTTTSTCVKQRKENPFFKVLVTIIANENFECLSIAQQRQLLNSFKRLMNESFAES